jgi:hypothetical protein
MSNRIAPYGVATVSAAASDIIAVYSLDSAKVYTKSSTASYWGLVGTTTPGIEYASSALSAAKEVRIEAGGDEVFYSVGAAAVVTNRRGLRGQGAPTALNTTGALTAAAIGSGIVTSTTAAAVTATIPTGAVMEAGVELAIGESIDWSVINTGDTNAITVTAAASGHTVVGAGAVAAETSGLFRTRKTAASTYITYRVG